jgi:hypothetical protein
MALFVKCWNSATTCWSLLRNTELQASPVSFILLIIDITTLLLHNTGFAWLIKLLSENVYPIVFVDIFLEKNKKNARPQLRRVIKSAMVFTMLMRVFASVAKSYGLLHTEVIFPNQFSDVLFLYVIPILINFNSALQGIFYGPVFHFMLYGMSNIDPVTTPSMWIMYRPYTHT